MSYNLQNHFTNNYFAASQKQTLGYIYFEDTWTKISCLWILWIFFHTQQIQVPESITTYSQKILKLCLTSVCYWLISQWILSNWITYSLKHDLGLVCWLFAEVKQLTKDSLQLAFVNPACLAGFPLKWGGIINTGLEDIPYARGNILARSLNQQWEKTGLTAGQSEPPDGAQSELASCGQRKWEGSMLEDFGLNHERVCLRLTCTHVCCLLLLNVSLLCICFYYSPLSLFSMTSTTSPAWRLISAGSCFS